MDLEMAGAGGVSLGMPGGEGGSPHDSQTRSLYTLGRQE